MVMQKVASASWGGKLGWRGHDRLDHQSKRSNDTAQIAGIV